LAKNKKSNLKNIPFLSPIEERLNFFAKKTIISLSIIGLISLLVRLYYFDPEIPLTYDALRYFFYAADISVLGHLPTNYTPANNGWSVFLSMFFSIFQFDNVISYMQLQRLFGIIISVLTIIPVYFLCNKFFEKRYSIVGTAIFAFEPRLIQNSLLGITEPLYILLGTIALVLFLSTEKKIVYISFGIAALTSIIRAEGLFLFPAISIMFFIRYRKERLVIPKFLLASIIFVLILLPMASYKIEASGTDNLIMRVFDSISTYNISSVDESSATSILTGLENFPKYLGWNLIPIFIFFAPIGFILIFNNLNYRTITIIVSLVSMSLPAFFAYSFPLPDTRYFYFLFPLFCVLSLFTIKKFVKKFSNQNLILISIIASILLASGIFLDYKIDNEHQKEAFFIAKHVADSTTAINDYKPESGFLQVVDIPQEWQILEPYFHGEREKGISTITLIPHQTSVIPVKGFESLEEYIEISKDKGLTHLVLDGKQERPDFLNDVFYNDKKYPYLIKEYDSFDFGLKYHVKILKIDYKIFELTKQKVEN